MGSDEEGYKGYSVVSLPNKIKDERDETSSGLLEDVASYLIVFTHSCAEKVTCLPFPMGTIMEAVEELVVPFTHPVEGFTLHFCAALDDQIYAVGTSIEGCILCTSGKLKLIITLLHTRGPIGMSADFWVQHKALMREKMQTMIDLANSIPLFGLMMPFVCAISAPVANAISNWLVEYSQSQDGKIQFHHKDVQGGKESSDEVEEKPGNRSVHATEIVEAENVKEEVEKEPVDVTLKKDVMGATTGKAKKGAQEHKVGKVTHKDKENDANDVSAVLEMIDSGWLLGSGGPVSPKTSAAAAPKTLSNPKKPANPKTRRGFLRH